MFFSVIIPTYNRAQIILSSVKSIIAQNFKEWELIIVDDGSTDGTKKVLDPYLTDERIRYFKKENGGVCTARNFGAEKAHGKYLVFLDSDDEAFPHLLATHKKNIQQAKGDCGISFAGFMNYEDKLTTPRNGGKFFQQQTVRVNSGAYAVLKNVFIEAGMFDERIKQSENWELMIRMVHYCQLHRLELVSCNEAVFKYHKEFGVHKKGIRDTNRYEAFKLIYEKYKKLGWFPSKHLSEFPENVAASAYRLKDSPEAIKWQFRSVKEYPFAVKPWLRLFKYLVRIR